MSHTIDAENIPMQAIQSAVQFKYIQKKNRFIGIRGKIKRISYMNIQDIKIAKIPQARALRSVSATP